MPKGGVIFHTECSRVLLDVEKTNNWKEIRDAFSATWKKKEDIVYLQASVVLNVTNWTIYEKFHEMVLQIKTTDIRLTKRKANQFQMKLPQTLWTWREFLAQPYINCVKERKKLSLGGKGQENYENRRRRIMPRK